MKMAFLREDVFASFLVHEPAWDHFIVNSSLEAFLVHPGYVNLVYKSSQGWFCFFFFCLLGIRTSSLVAAECAELEEVFFVLSCFSDWLLTHRCSRLEPQFSILGGPWASTLMPVTKMKLRAAHVGRCSPGKAPEELLFWGFSLSLWFWPDNCLVSCLPINPFREDFLLLLPSILNNFQWQN